MDNDVQADVEADELPVEEESSDTLLCVYGREKEEEDGGSMSILSDSPSITRSSISSRNPDDVEVEVVVEVEASDDPDSLSVSCPSPEVGDTASARPPSLTNRPFTRSRRSARFLRQ